MNEIQDLLKSILSDKEIINEQFTYPPVRSSQPQPGDINYHPIFYTINYAVPNKEKTGAKLYQDHPDSKKPLNKAMDRAEQIFSKYGPDVNIYATMWQWKHTDGSDDPRNGEYTIVDYKELHTPPGWAYPLIKESSVFNESTIIDNDIPFKGNEQELVIKFLDYIKTKLNMNKMPNIHVVSVRDETMKTYGQYEPDIDTIKVYGKNRGLADVLRTIVHEIIHYWQKITGKFPENMEGRNQELETEANALAGDYIYMFGLENPTIYNLGAFDDSIS